MRNKHGKKHMSRTTGGLSYCIVFCNSFRPKGLPKGGRFHGSTCYGAINQSAVFKRPTTGGKEMKAR